MAAIIISSQSRIGSSIHRNGFKWDQNSAKLYLIIGFLLKKLSNKELVEKNKDISDKKLKCRRLKEFSHQHKKDILKMGYHLNQNKF